MTAPIATLTIDPRYLPLTPREAGRLADQIEATLTMIAAEYRKGEHLDTVRIEIMLPPPTAEIDHVTSKSGTTAPTLGATS